MTSKHEKVTGKSGFSKVLKSGRREKPDRVMPYLQSCMSILTFDLNLQSCQQVFFSLFTMTSFVFIPTVCHLSLPSGIFWLPWTCKSSLLYQLLESDFCFSIF